MYYRKKKYLHITKGDSMGDHNEPLELNGLKGEGKTIL